MKAILAVMALFVGLTLAVGCSICDDRYPHGPHIGVGPQGRAGSVLEPGTELPQTASAEFADTREEQISEEVPAPLDY